MDINQVKQGSRQEISTKSQLKRMGAIGIDFSTSHTSTGKAHRRLFCFENNEKLKNYMSMNPDLECLATNALYQEWRSHFPYLFPPFCLLGRVLNKVREESIHKALFSALLLVSSVNENENCGYNSSPKIKKIAKKSSGTIASSDNHWKPSTSPEKIGVKRDIGGGFRYHPAGKKTSERCLKNV